MSANKVMRINITKYIFGDSQPVYITGYIMFTDDEYFKGVAIDTSELSKNNDQIFIELKGEDKKKIIFGKKIGSELHFGLSSTEGIFDYGLSEIDNSFKGIEKKTEYSSRPGASVDEYIEDCSQTITANASAKLIKIENKKIVGDVKNLIKEMGYQTASQLKIIELMRSTGEGTVFGAFEKRGKILAKRKDGL